jgi:hypothetical protein
LPTFRTSTSDESVDLDYDFLRHDDVSRIALEVERSPPKARLRWSVAGVYTYSLGMKEPEVTTYERNLREVFWQDDPDFVSRAARVCVLYEDLRIEHHGARFLEPIEELDDIGKAFRQFYFIRRSLVTLIEFSGALNRLNAIKPWREHVEKEDDEIKTRWQAAIKYFNDNHRKWETLRGDIGGHYPERAADFSVRHLQSDSTGKLIVRKFREREEAGVLLEFATEFVAVAMRRTLAKEDPTIEEIRSFMRGLFEVITEGWQHAVSAVNVVVAQFLLPRFAKD